MFGPFAKESKANGKRQTANGVNFSLAPCAKLKFTLLPQKDEQEFQRRSALFLQKRLYKIRKRGIMVAPNEKGELLWAFSTN